MNLKQQLIEQIERASTAVGVLHPKLHECCMSFKEMAERNDDIAVLHCISQSFSQFVVQVTLTINSQTHDER